MMQKQDGVFIIAEIGVNHNGDLDKALQLIDAAVDAGADAVKFQSYRTESLVSQSTKMAKYQQTNVQADISQFALLKQYELTRAQHILLKRHCLQRGIAFLSTPFDHDSLAMLIESCQVEKIKVGSGDLTNYPLLFAIAKERVPVIISTGMADLTDIQHALQALALGFTQPNEQPTMDASRLAYYSDEGQAALASFVTVLQCTTAYPAPPQGINLKAMQTIRHAFHLPVGFSDHSEGIHIAIAAAALGASVIEKHITLDRNLPGPDHQASIEPDTFTQMVTGIRDIELALGDGLKRPSVDALENAKVATRVIVAAKKINAGETFSEKNLMVKRAGLGLSSQHYWALLGNKATKNYVLDEVITHES